MILLWRRRKKIQQQPPEYVTTDSGFRYRLLGVTVDDGYRAAIARLLPGEELFRMMDGVHRVRGKLFPVRIGSEENYDQCVAAMIVRGWQFQLAGGILPTRSDDATSPPAIPPLTLGHAARTRRL
ncbi:MAG TPA: hypothetical protein VLF91_04055 [Candidatus Saccharimonadales bacterium]|nr:hypothetical protein [Candidatus Saccharimonadales bacterium]